MGNAHRPCHLSLKDFMAKGFRDLVAISPLLGEGEQQEAERRKHLDQGAQIDEGIGGAEQKMGSGFVAFLALI